MALGNFERSRFITKWQDGIEYQKGNVTNFENEGFVSDGRKITRTSLESRSGN